MFCFDLFFCLVQSGCVSRWRSHRYRSRRRDTAFLERLQQDTLHQGRLQHRQTDRVQCCLLGHIVSGLDLSLYFYITIESQTAVLLTRLDVMWHCSKLGQSVCSVIFDWKNNTLLYFFRSIFIALTSCDSNDISSHFIHNFNNWTQWMINYQGNTFPVKLLDFIFFYLSPF